MRKPIQLATVVAAVLGATSLPGWAVDGVVLIDQAKAMAGGVTPGDTAGFPVTINQPGSYKLSGNLTVPNENTGGIVINASHVTLDLNGFAILGPTDCSGQMNPCVRQGTSSAGWGIQTSPNTPQFNITVRNGTIQGLGSGGIQLFGDSNLIEYVHARSNGGSGILARQSQDAGSTIVQHSTAQRNEGLGIDVDRGSVRYNVVDVNLSSGISVGVGSVSYNVVTRNLVGINNGNGASLFGNTMRDNTSGNVVGAGANLGQNFCSGVGGSC